MNVKKQARLRRARRTRAKISQLNVNRLCVFRTPRHSLCANYFSKRRRNSGERFYPGQVPAWDNDRECRGGFEDWRHDSGASESGGCQQGCIWPRWI